METYTTAVENVTYETQNIIFLDLSYPEDFSFQPGQYVSLEIQRGETTRYKPYSIYSPPSNDTLRLCIKLVDGGFASEHFKQLQGGDTFTMRGPLGRFLPDHSNNQHRLLCTGAGIAPLHSMLCSLIREEDNGIALYHGVRTPEALIEPEHYKSLEDEHESFSYNPVFSRVENAERSGYVQDYLDIDEGATYYLCGVKDFVESTEAFLKQGGVSEALINRERFT